MPKRKNNLCSFEFILLAMLVLFGFINTYICFGSHEVARKAVIIVFSLMVLFLTVRINSETFIKETCTMVYVLFLLCAIIITVFKNATGYIVVGNLLALNVSDLIFPLTVWTSVALCRVDANSNINNKFAVYLVWILPVIIISAFNLSSAAFVFILTVAVTKLVFWASKNCKVEKVIGYSAIVLLAICVISISAILILMVVTKNFSLRFSGSEVTADVADCRLTYCIYKCGAIFPLFLIVSNMGMCLSLVLKSFHLKTRIQRTFVFSAGFATFVNLVLACVSEVVFGSNNSFFVPLLSGYSCDLIVIIVIGLAVSILRRYSEGKDALYYLGCISSSLKSGLRKSNPLVAFISYRRETGMDLAMHTHDRLRLKGYDSFFDIESMKSGKFNEQIYAKIEECDNFILILSKGALDRCSNEEDWVRKEVAYAIKKNKNIISLMTNDFEFPSVLPEEIEDIRYYEAIKSSSDLFDYVIEKLIKMMVL